MSLDYGEVCIGRPAEVMERLARRLGQLNFASANIRVGVTGDPAAAWARLGRERPWGLMKLLWITHSFAQAREMAGLLRAWDAKVFDSQGPEPDQEPCRRSSSFYAFVVLR